MSAYEHTSGPWRQAIGDCLAGRIGAHGLSPEDLAAEIAALAPALDDLRGACRERSLGLMRIVEDRDDIERARDSLARLSEGANKILFFGTGGSSLGGQTLAQLAGWNIPGDMRSGQKQRPRTRFYDNLDPFTLEGTFTARYLENTRFVITSKSGNTAETLAQTIVALERIKAVGLGDAIPRMFLGISEPHAAGRHNGLRKLLEDHGVEVLDHPTDIGGRFSALSITGLVPAISQGVDPVAVREGAGRVISELLEAAEPGAFAPAVGAATAIALARHKGIGTSVMMPYGDRLARFAAWYGQLWAESLGKAGNGTTPVAALGPVDQHSQLQLFMDGPADHLITFVRPATQDLGPRLDPDLARRAGIDYLAGRTVGDLVAAQSHAVPQALAEAGRPVRTLDVAVLDEAAMGALMMHFMIETILAARLLGIDPFDQPAVETGKRLARARLEQRR